MRNVTRITTALKMPPPNVSHHLAVLKHARLIQGEKQGRLAIHSPCPRVLEEVVEAGVSREALNLGCCRLVLPPEE